MVQISDLVVSKLGAGLLLEAWYEGKSLAAELGYDHHLMGMPPPIRLGSRAFRRIGVGRVTCRCRWFDSASMHTTHYGYRTMLYLVMAPQ